MTKNEKKNPTPKVELIKISVTRDLTRVRSQNPKPNLWVEKLTQPSPKISESLFDELDLCL